MAAQIAPFPRCNTAANKVFTDLGSTYFTTHLSNLSQLPTSDPFTADFVASTYAAFPEIDTLLQHVTLTPHYLPFVKTSIDKELPLSQWAQQHCEKAGGAMQKLVRKRKTAAAAVDAWRLTYPSVQPLFDDVPAIEPFLTAIANNLLRVDKLGMMFRVGSGALLSSVDAITDIVVIKSYYESAGDDLTEQANALLAMIVSNTSFQILGVLAQYRNESVAVRLREILITLAFLRPAADAYRVCRNDNTNDSSRTADPLQEMVANKGIELATESIPGCVLQLYVYFKSDLGFSAMLSIAISALTTGYASAMIAYDMDVDVPNRRKQPKFYGYIPDDNGKRNRCFKLLVLMCTLHNLSRSVGTALLIARSKNLAIAFAAIEMILFFVFKIVRNDYFAAVNVEGFLSLFGSFVYRLLVKVISDFSGCIHFRHPKELGSLVFGVFGVYNQMFPFIALQYYKGKQEGVFAFLLATLALYIAVSAVFFCSINASFISTFFGTKTAAQYERAKRQAKRGEEI